MKFKPKVARQLRNFVMHRLPGESHQLVRLERQTDPISMDPFKPDLLVRYEATYFAELRQRDDEPLANAEDRAARLMVQGLYDDTVMELKRIRRQLLLDGMIYQSPRSASDLDDLIDSLEGNFT